MTHNEIKRAYEAIKDHVRTHVTGDADDLFCACQDAFDRQKHKYDEKKGEIEDFAAGVARRQLANEQELIANRKCREVEHYDSRALRHGEKAERKRISALVEKALKKLPAEDRGIIAWELCGLSLNLLADIWGVSHGWFNEGFVQPARQKFAKAFGEVVGNPKLYAKLRSEVLAKKAQEKGANE